MHRIVHYFNIGSTLYSNSKPVKNISKSIATCGGYNAGNTIVIYRIIIDAKARGN
jgi:hypothetical protein